MSGSPLVESRVRDIQSRATARRELREKQNAELAERSRKSQEADQADQAERRATYSPNDVTAMARMKAVTDGYAQQHQRQQEQEDAERHKKWWDQMTASKAEFYDLTTTPFRRGQAIVMFCEAYQYVNGKRIAPEDVLKLWDDQKKQEARDQVVRRLRVAVGESS